MALIFVAGGDAGSAQVTRGGLSRLLEWLLPGLDPSALEVVNVALRKGGHLLSYALLAVLDYRAAQGWLPRASRAARPVAWLAAVGWAAVDEFHQSFYASRGGSIEDVVLDAAGAAVGLAMAIRFRKDDTSCS